MHYRRADYAQTTCGNLKVILQTADNFHSFQNIYFVSRVTWPVVRKPRYILCMCICNEDTLFPIRFSPHYFSESAALLCSTTLCLSKKRDQIPLLSILYKTKKNTRNSLVEQRGTTTTRWRTFQKQKKKTKQSFLGARQLRLPKPPKRSGKASRSTW